MPGVMLYLTFWFPINVRAKVAGFSGLGHHWHLFWAGHCREDCYQCTVRLACTVGKLCS